MYVYYTMNLRQVQSLIAYLFTNEEFRGTISVIFCDERVSKVKDKKNHSYGNTFTRAFNEYPNGVLIALLVLCPPAGLVMMWRRGCAWQRWVKSLVSALIVAAVVLVLVLLPSLPNPEPEGSVEIHVKETNKRAFAPFKPDGVPDTAQVLSNGAQGSSLISEPTPTPDPLRVYCNDNGLYYHYAECRYVYDTTPRVTLVQAINAGKSACPDCKPPSEVSY